MERALNLRASELPQVSVVMPVKNEALYIERSLGSVLAQDYPAHLLEVLVADGMSTDGTRRLVERLSEGRRVRVIDNPAGIVAPGLNAALAEARGEIIIRVDGHCEIAPDYVRRAVDHLGRGGIAGVGGPIETVGETPLARAIAVAMSSRFGVGGAAFRTGREAGADADTIPFPAYPRRVLDAAGAFDEELVRNQDDEYNYRLRGRGEKLLLTPDLSSRYYSRADLRSLFRQYFQYGYYKVRVLQKHPRQMRGRQFAPPLLVAALLSGWILALVTPLALFLSAGVAALYLATAGVASALVARKVPRRFWPLMPVIFAALHLGYGSGFLVGLLRFARRW